MDRPLDVADATEELVLGEALVEVAEPAEQRPARREEPLVALRGPLSVRFATITGKRVDGPEAEGLLVRLSIKEAEVEARERPEPFRNLRLRFVARDGSTIAGELYGKVTAPRMTTKGFGLAFTSVPPEIRSFLEAILAGSR